VEHSGYRTASHIHTMAPATSRSPFDVSKVLHVFMERFVSVAGSWEALAFVSAAAVLALRLMMIVI
jgi:hypothetical protein